MSHLLWLLAGRLARLLDFGEREAVLGDLAEFGETGGRALRAVSGVVMRRQVALWRSWRTWLLLAGVVVPLGVVLALVSRGIADGDAISIWFYANNWDWHLFGNAGFWYGLIQSAPGALMSLLALACWSWTGGFLVASLSRRTLWCNGILFCLVLLWVDCVGLPRSFGHVLLLGRARDFQGNAVVFARGFYRVLFPLILQLALVLLPLFWGMRHRLEWSDVPLPSRMLLWVFALATVFMLVAESSVWWQVRTWMVFPPRLPLLPSPLPFALLGPVGYLLTTILLRGRRHIAVLS